MARHLRDLRGTPPWLGSCRRPIGIPSRRGARRENTTANQGCRFRPGHPHLPHHLNTFTATLLQLGFISAGETLTGHQHRWLRDKAVVDVLIPRFTGERSENRPGATGGTTIAAPAVQQAVDQSEVVEVEAGASVGKVNRPSLMGTLIGKAAALAIKDDPGRERHVTDLLTLATVVAARDLRGYRYQPASRNHMANMLGNLTTKPEWMALLPEAKDGVERLKMSL